MLDREEAEEAQEDSGASGAATEPPEQSGWIPDSSEYHIHQQISQASNPHSDDIQSQSSNSSCSEDSNAAFLHRVQLKLNEQREKGSNRAAQEASCTVEVTGAIGEEGLPEKDVGFQDQQQVGHTGLHSASDAQQK